MNTFVNSTNALWALRHVHTGSFLSVSFLIGSTVLTEPHKAELKLKDGFVLATQENIDVNRKINKRNIR
jgi:hypothetical protein